MWCKWIRFASAFVFEYCVTLGLRFSSRTQSDATHVINDSKLTAKQQCAAIHLWCCYSNAVYCGVRRHRNRGLFSASISISVRRAQHSEYACSNWPRHLAKQNLLIYSHNDAEPKNDFSAAPPPLRSTLHTTQLWTWMFSARFLNAPSSQTTSTTLFRHHVCDVCVCGFVKIFRSTSFRVGDCVLCAKCI